MQKTQVHWDLNSPTPVQLKELFAQISTGCISKARLQSFLEGNSRSLGFELAHRILGQGFIPPREIAEKFSVCYTDSQLQHFVATLPSKDVLIWCHKNDYVLVAGPPNPMSVVDICNLKPTLHFHVNGEMWYRRWNETFAYKEVVRTNWILLRKDPVPNSVGKDWSEQEKLIKNGDYVPNAAEVIWVGITIKEVGGRFLLPRTMVRTSSIDSWDRHVPCCVGNECSIGNDEKIGLSCCHDDKSSDCQLGLATARYL